MAQKVTVVLDDDLTGGPAEQTVRFSFDGTDYEIDLNAKNAAALHKQLASYLEHARRAGRAPSRRGRTAAGRQRSGDIRAWAKEHGLAVSERGRIPVSVAEQYHAAGGRRLPHGTRSRLPTDNSPWRRMLDVAPLAPAYALTASGALHHWRWRLDSARSAAPMGGIFVNRV